MTRSSPSMCVEMAVKVRIFCSNHGRDSYLRHGILLMDMRCFQVLLTTKHSWPPVRVLQQPKVRSETSSDTTGMLVQFLVRKACTVCRSRSLFQIR